MDEMMHAPEPGDGTFAAGRDQDRENILEGTGRWIDGSVWWDRGMIQNLIPSCRK